MTQIGIDKDWTIVDEGWGRKAIDFATLSEPGNAASTSLCTTNFVWADMIAPWMSPVVRGWPWNLRARGGLDVQVSTRPHA